MSKIISLYEFKEKRKLVVPEGLDFSGIKVEIPDIEKEEIQTMAVEIAKTFVFPVMYGEGNKTKSLLLLLNILSKCGVDLQEEGRKFQDELDQAQRNNNGHNDDQTDKRLDSGGSDVEEKRDKGDSPS